ncbi:MAG: hypothetical protein RR533_04535 [Carnobacterium sp.]
MYKIGDKVRVTYVDTIDSNITEGEVFEVIGTETESHVRVNTRGHKYWPMRYDQIEKVEESKEMTFPEMVQKLIDGDFEVGTELVADNNSYFVDRVMWSNNYGLKSDISETTVMVNLSAHALNSTWTVQKQPTKEMSIEELQKELGYKIKIVERESK